jgi:hypothetical protein
LSETASRIGARLVVDGEVDAPVGVPGLDEFERAFGFERGGEGEFDLQVRAIHDHLVDH